MYIETLCTSIPQRNAGVAMSKFCISSHFMLHFPLKEPTYNALFVRKKILHIYISFMPVQRQQELGPLRPTC